MGERASYSRVYWGVVDDPKFATIYDNHAAFGVWVKLLMIADQAWPASATLPPDVSRRMLALLTDSGLVDPQAGWRYRIHGLDAERERRKVAATRGVPTGPQLVPNRGPEVPGTTDLRRDETREAEESRDETDGRADLEAYLVVRFRPPTPKQREFMDAYVRHFDVTGPQRAANLILRNPNDPIGALKADLDAFRQERIAAAQKEERPAPVRSRRKATGFTGVNAELQKLLTEQYAAADIAHAHRMGEHTASVPACPLCQETAA